MSSAMWRRFLMIALMVPLLLAGVGCGGSKQRKLAPDISFSVNLIEVPEDWPIEKKDWPKDPKQALQQQQVYEKYGKPDYFRILWRKDGRIITQGELTQRMSDKTRDKKKFVKNQGLEFEWIYLEKGLAFQFPKTGVKKADLPDTMRVIAENGDPHEVKEANDINGFNTLIYQYYDLGKVVYFRDGKKIREDKTTELPGMIMKK